MAIKLSISPLFSKKVWTYTILLTFDIQDTVVVGRQNDGTERGELNLQREPDRGQLRLVGGEVRPVFALTVLYHHICFLRYILFFSPPMQKGEDMRVIYLTRTRGKVFVIYLMQFFLNLLIIAWSMNSNSTISLRRRGQSSRWSRMRDERWDVSLVLI